ncbi:MAG TPA: hypothetical protein VGN16_03675 [Acidobacteriaceae bacterium]|jgi:hypothetical protein
MLSVRKAAVLLCLVFVCVGCEKFKATGQEGQHLDEGLHASMAHGDWNGIYANADGGYRDGVTPEKSQALFSNIVRKLGAPVSTQQVGWRAMAGTSGTFLRSECSTKFANNAIADETIVWKKGSDGAYRLYNYNISSEDLITR